MSDPCNAQLDADAEAESAQSTVQDEIESVQAHSELDVESLYEESPTDGYFAQRPHLRELFMFNSPATEEAGAKAREAAEQRRADNLRVASSPPREATSPGRPPGWHGDAIPILDAGPAPPDYFAATAHRSQPQASHQRYGSDGSETFTGNPSYGSIEQSGQSRQWPFEEGDGLYDQNPSAGASGGPFTNNRQPISMSDPVDTRAPAYVDEETGLLTRQASKRRSQRKRLWNRDCCKTMSCFNVLVALAIITLLILLGSNSTDWRTGSGSNGSKRRPITGDDDDHHDDVDDTPSTQPNSTIPVPSHPHTSTCPFDSYSDAYVIDFAEPSNFAFVELTESSSFGSGRISGTVEVRPAEPDQNVDIRLWVSYAMTRPYQVERLRYTKSEDTFVLHMPYIQKGVNGYSDIPCMDISVWISVRPGVKLDNWQVATANLNTVVSDGLFNVEPGKENLSALQISNSSLFSSTSGDVNVSYWSSRKIEIDLLSGSVSGIYALRDLLSVRTTSGSQDVAVVPKDADPDKPLPAEFVAISSSGHINTRFPIMDSLPKRDYRSRIESSSSSIQGAYLLGTTTTFKTSSGSIRASLLPYAVDSRVSKLHTEVRSGSTELEVLTPYSAAGEPWALESTHKSTSTSGSLNLVYPKEWEGTIIGETMSGTISIDGKDTKTVAHEHHGMMLRRVVVRKGTGRGKIECRTSSGSITVRIGE